MKPTNLLRGIVILSALSLTACQSSTPTDVPAKDIPVISVSQRNVPNIQEFPGQVYGIQDIPIRARVEGFLEKMAFREGSQVQKGDLLYEIDPLPYRARLNAAKSKLAQAEVSSVKAKSDLDRIRPLAERNAVSKSDLDAAVANYDAALAAVEAAKAEVELAEIELSYAVIRAPITGVIGKTSAREGEYVGRSPNPVILNTVSKIDSFRVEFFIPESRYLQLMRNVNTENGERNPVDFHLILSDESRLTVTGKFDFLDRAIESSTGSIRAQVIFPNENSIVRPGQFVRLEVRQARKDEVVLIPERCVNDLQGKKFVYIIDENGAPKQVNIELGTTRWNDLIVVKSGLSVGDRLVLEGSQSIMRGGPIHAVDTTFQSVNGFAL